MIDRIEDVPRVASPDTTQALPSKPNVLVVDASVIASFVADGGPGGDKVRARLRGESIAGPDLLRVEVMSVIRASPMPGPSR